MIERVAVDGAILGLDLPEGAHAAPPSPLDLAGAPGVELAVQRAWRADGARAELACARADGRWWLPGLEDQALGAMAAVARRTLALDRIELADKQPFAGGYLQGFEGTHAAGPAHGQLLLGFTEASGDVLICSSGCVGCQAPLTAAGLGPPRPGPLAALVAAGAARPGAAVAAIAALGLALTALVLWRRPRPRP